MDAAYELEFYKTSNGKCPFQTWRRKLDQVSRNVINTRLARLRLGHLGDAKSLQGVRGIYELRVHCGPGYRIYFGKQGKRLLLLLCGGTQGSQKADIERVKRYWKEHAERK